MQPQDNQNSVPVKDPQSPEASGQSIGESTAPPNNYNAPVPPQNPVTPAFSPANDTSSTTPIYQTPSAAYQPSSQASNFGSLPVAGKSKKKFLIAGIITAVIVLGGSAGAYFGIYLPSQPENIWKQSLQNSGKGYDKLVGYASQKTDIKGGKLTGDFKFEAGKSIGDGTIESRSDDKNSDTKISIGASGSRLEMNILSNIPEGAKNPDIYAKVSGLKGIDKILGPEAAGIGASLASLENQWYVLDHTIFAQAEKEEKDIGSNLTYDDFVKTANTVGEVSKDHVFTGDQAKSIFSRKENVGKEKLDGRNVYHYKVGIHKENLKAYNKALCDRLSEDKVFKTLSMTGGSSAEESKKQCSDTKDIDGIKESDTADVFVDLKTKLVRIVRITDKDKKDNYFDLGLLYDGGDKYPFVLRGQSKDDKGEGKGELKFTLDTKANKVIIVASANGKDSGGEAFKFTMNAVAVPSNEKVEFKKPEGAKSILEAYGSLIGGFGGASGGSVSPGVPDQTLINRCIAETTPSPECKALFNEQ